MPFRSARLAALLGHARIRHLLIAGGLVIGASVAAAMMWFVLLQRQTYIDDAARELRNDALMLAEEEDRLLQSVDVVQLSLIEHMRELDFDDPTNYERLAGLQEVYRNLKDRIAGFTYIASLALTDRRGRLLNYSRAWPPPDINDGERDFIRELMRTGGPKTFISEPSRSRSVGAWTIYLSRRFETADGELIGFVVSTIEMDYFEQFYARLPLTGGGSFTLYRRDGILMARYPHVDPQIGRSFGATENFRQVLASLDKGVIRLTSMFDGQERLIAPYAMAHFPLIMTVTDTVESILAPWRREARMVAVAVALLELVIAATILLTVRQVRAYERLQAAETAQARAEAELALSEQREQAAHVLQQQSQRFDIALNTMLQGLMMFDRQGGLLVANRRACHMFGVPDGTLVPGMSYRDVTEAIVAAGHITAEDMEGIRERRDGRIARDEQATHTWEIADGRAFNLTHLPTEEGWLATFEDITDQRASEARMAHLAHHDALTDLPNRVLFRRKLEEALAYARRGGILALLYLDLDQFKAVNDTLGHPVGDELLRAVAERLVRHTRETDTVARLGGDEFAIVQTAVTRPTEATTFAGRLIELLSAPFEVDGHHIVIGASAGIAFAPQDGMDADQLLRCADLAMYRAKTDGRGVYRLFHAEMDAQMQARRLLELDLRQAMRCGQLEVFYQPLISVDDQAIAGFEALLRWHHPQRGTVPPSDFIPLAEEIGLIVPIGEWVLQQACEAAVSWPAPLKVAVNLSSVQFRSRNLVGAVESALRASELAAWRLELEITETVILEDADATLATLRKLRALGVHVAMDDFGTGYSSLSYLRRFPFDRIKIDQSFVRELGTRRDCMAIVRAVAALSVELGMATTAEGVETQEQLDALAAVGCGEVQGYLFSPAVPGGEIPALLARISAMFEARRSVDAGNAVACG